MGESTQESKGPPSTQIELITDINSSQLLLNEEDSKGARHESYHHARRIISRSTLTQGLLDIAMSIASIYFIVFALMVYSRRKTSIDLPGNMDLLEAAKLSPTLFPILFAAIVARFLRALAAYKLEGGASILMIDHLLNSRSVFSALVTPFNLKTFNLTTFGLLLLWGLSPIGGQAGLRVILTAPFYTNTTSNFTYLAFVSEFTNEGIGSASAELLAPINAAFTAAIVSSSQSKVSPQDPFGNIKIPVYEYLDPALPDKNSPWREVPDDGEVVWSSITGLPILGLPSNGTSRFILNTGYMLTDCKTSSQTSDSISTHTFIGLKNATMYWSGANFGIDCCGPMNNNLTFKSLATGATELANRLVIAECTVTMSYVMVQIQCEGVNCRSVAARPSTKPASHATLPGFDTGRYATPLGGLGQSDTMYIDFIKNFVTSTSPADACDTTTCPISVIEGYLGNPGNPFSASGDFLWTIGDQLISHRIGQLLNTYWIDSVAPFAIAGNFSMPKKTSESPLSDMYSTDTSPGTIERLETVIECNLPWLGILLLASGVSLIVSVAGGILNVLRRGPSILDSFSPLIRDNQYCASELPHHSSMEDGSDQSYRLRNVIVRLGDVKPEEDVGHVAIAVLNDNNIVERLSSRRKYD